MKYLFKMRYSFADLIGIGGSIAVIVTHQWWGLIAVFAWLIIVVHYEGKYNDN